MFQPNFAGITCHVEHHERLEEAMTAVNETYCPNDPMSGPLRMHLSLINSPSVAVFCKSIDSMPMSAFIRRLEVQDIPHRIISAPWIPGRACHSFSRDGKELTLHVKPYDMYYSKNFLLSDQVSITVDHQMMGVRKIIVVGPHREARAAYRWTAWWLRDKKHLSSKWVAGLNARQIESVCYIQLDNDKWIILARGECHDGVATGLVVNEKFIATLNGFRSIDV